MNRFLCLFRILKGKEIKKIVKAFPPLFIFDNQCTV